MRKPWAVVLIAVAAVAALACAHPHEVGEDGSPWQPPATVDTGTTPASTPSGGTTTSGTDVTAQVCDEAISTSNTARTEINTAVAQRDLATVLSKALALKTTLTGLRDRPGVSAPVKQALQAIINLIDQLLAKSPEELAADGAAILAQIDSLLGDLDRACGQ